MTTMQANGVGHGRQRVTPMRNKREAEDGTIDRIVGVWGLLGLVVIVAVVLA